MKKTKKFDNLRVRFEFFQEMGNNVDCIIGTVDQVTGKISSRKFSHIDFDGYSAIKEFCREKNWISWTELRKQKKPGLLKAIYFLFLGLLFNVKKGTKQTHPFFYDCSLQAIKSCETNAFLLFSQNAFKSLEVYCKKMNYTLTSFLICSFSEVLLELFPEKLKKNRYIWFLPVNLRGPEEEAKIGNQVGGLYFNLMKDFNPIKIKLTLSRLLKKLMHWIPWYTGFLFRFFSKKSLIKGYNAFNSNCIGTFSNFGKWDINFPAGEKNSLIFAISPVSHHIPIGIACFSNNNALTVSVRSSSFLSEKNITGKAVLEKLKEKLVLIVDNHETVSIFEL